MTAPIRYRVTDPVLVAKVWQAAAIGEVLDMMASVPPAGPASAVAAMLERRRGDLRAHLNGRLWREASFRGHDLAAVESVSVLADETDGGILLEVVPCAAVDETPAETGSRA